MTKAEVCLLEIRFKNEDDVEGYTFNRQRPVLNYIADFMYKELLLITLKLTGFHYNIMQHLITKTFSEQQNLEHIGYKVIRFNDNDVLKRY